MRHRDWDATDSSASNGRRVLPGLASEFLALGRETLAAEPTPGQLHQLRLAGKHLRYSLELFRGHYGADLQGIIQTLKTFQGALGEISDCDATEDLIRSEGLAGTTGGEALLQAIESNRSFKVRMFLLTWRKQLDRPELEESWVETLGSRTVPSGGNAD